MTGAARAAGATLLCTDRIADLVTRTARRAVEVDRTTASLVTRTARDPRTSPAISMVDTATSAHRTPGVRKESIAPATPAAAVTRTARRAVEVDQTTASLAIRMMQNHISLTGF